MAELIDNVTGMEEDTQKGKFLTFMLGKETYGIEIAYVMEIIGIQTITEMPEMPDYIKGIINLRGKIIPVMDVRLRFKKESKICDDRTCVIVINFNGFSVGLVVDSVSEVLTIQDDDISELPAINTGHSSGYVKNIGKIDGCVVLLLDCGKLLSDEEVESLSNII